MAAPRRFNIFTIAPSAPFLDTLAEAVDRGTLTAAAAPDGLARADITILLPTRRACRVLREVFLERAGAGAAILPRIRPVGDIDEEAGALAADLPDPVLDLPPTIGATERVLVLARLVQRFGTVLARTENVPGLDDPLQVTRSPAEAVALARALAEFLDGAATEDVDLSRLDGLVPDEFAAYYGLTLRFLRIITEHWPSILEERGLAEPVDRRNRVAEAEARRLHGATLRGPIIAAGSTGSIPATAKLLAAVAAHPQGALVLPGLDLQLPDDDFDALTAADEPGVSHPQFGMAQLLQRIGAGRDEVTEIGAPKPISPMAHRLKILSETMRPAARTAAWRAAPVDAENARQALEAVTLIEAANEAEEALVVALALRETIETPGKTAALVTPDRTLALRVSSELKRWGLAIDDSAGTPLAQTSAGVIARLVIDALAEGLAPVPLLALMKHPFFRLGREPAVVRGLARRLELAALRGPRPAPWTDGLRQVVGDGDPALTAFVSDLDVALAPLLPQAVSGAPSDLADLAANHWRVLEALSRDSGGRALIGATPDGETLAALVATLIDANADPFPLTLADYPGVFTALTAGLAVRPPGPSHPRLQILGLLEARLQQVDRVVLAGLNEGVWPDLPETDPWLSRPMRAAFGLAPPERRIGLSAHDFAQALAGGEVILTRARKTGGAPAIPSRWLQRLRAVLDIAGAPEALDPAPGMDLLALARGLDTVPDDQRPPPLKSPEPRPPVDLRPRRLSVTRIEHWVRDPYSIYARHVLELQPLDPIDAAPGGAERGTAIHDALAAFMRAPLERDPKAALDRLLRLGRAAFQPHAARPEVVAVWWPRFVRVAEWFVAEEFARRDLAQAHLIETDGMITFDAPAGSFDLTARADRLDILSDGALRIVDYKTGAVSSSKEVFTGLAPQLTLEAAIAQAGGFAGQAGPADRIAELVYLHLPGGTPPGDVLPRIPPRGADPDLAVQAGMALSELKTLIARFDDPATPYRAMQIPKFRLRYGDYDHLARIREWGLSEDTA